MTTNQFLEHVRLYCKEHGITMQMEYAEGVSYPNSDSMVNGFFDGGDQPRLAFAVGKPEHQWLPVLVHEFCHATQWAEKLPLWDDTKINGVCTTTLIDLWLNNHIEFTDEQKRAAFLKTVAVEADCEARVLAAILKYDLNISYPEYAQKANAYLCFHRVVELDRRWYDLGREPYNLPEVYCAMPTTLIEHPLDVTPPIIEALRKAFK